MKMCDQETGESPMQMECDFASDNDLSLFEDEGDLNEDICLNGSARPEGAVENKVSPASNLRNDNVGSLTFMSKSVFTLVSNIFKCPVSEETLKNNISLAAPKIPFLNIRPCDPWLKSFNPGLVPESLESEILTQRFISNFLRVAFPLINLLDTMSKGRLTQAKVETSVTDALLLLSSSLENVNNWRRENITRRYNLQHLKVPDVSPSENAFLFPSAFEKCAKYPSHEDIYQTNITLPDLEINSVAKFSNEVLSGPSFLDGIENKVQKIINEDRQNRGIKDIFTQTDESQERSKVACSVGSQVRTCNCSTALGSSAAASMDKTTLNSSEKPAGAANLSQQQPSANCSSSLKNEGGSNIRKTIVSDVSSGGNTDKQVSGFNGKGGVNNTSIITIADSCNTVSTASKNLTNNPAGNAMDNVNKVGSSHFASKSVSNVENVPATVASGSSLFQKTVDNSNAIATVNDDIIEIVPSATVGASDRPNEELFESGISIEDDEDETDNRGGTPLVSDGGSISSDVTGVSSEPVATKEMESEIVILELSDEAEQGGEESASVSKGQVAPHMEKPTAAAAGNRPSSISEKLGQQVTKASPQQGAAEIVTVKKKFVPITGPSPPQSKSASANSSSSSSQITVNNSKKRPIRSMPPNRQIPDKSLSDITSASGASNVMSKNRALGAAADDPLTRTVSHQHRLVTTAPGPGPRNPAVFQHAVSVAGFGVPLNTGQMSTAAAAASARVVRALADPYPNTGQQLEHEAAKRTRYDQSWTNFGGSSFSGGGGGMSTRSQQQDIWRGANNSGGPGANRRGRRGL